MAGYLGNIPTAVPLSSADLADGIITSAKIVDATIANADIANATIALAKLSATGTASASTFLRGDNTWGSVSSNTPVFYATMLGRGSDQSGIADNTDTKVQFVTEILDSDSAYDPTTNYRFTVPSGKAGKYFFSATVDFGRSGGNARSTYVSIYKNGGSVEQQGLFLSSQYFEGSQDCTITCTTVLDLAVADYIEVYGRRYDGTNTYFKYNVGNHFFGYKVA